MLQIWFHLLDAVKELLSALRRWDKALHDWISRSFPRAMPVVDSTIEGLFKIFDKGAFGIICALLLVVLVATGVIPLIVAASLIGVWFVSIIWIARLDSVKSLTVLSRLAVLMIAGTVIYFSANKFGAWAISQYREQRRLEQGEASKSSAKTEDKPDSQLQSNQPTETKPTETKPVETRPSPHQKAIKPSKSQADVEALLVIPKNLSIAAKNTSTEIAWDIKYEAILWNLDESRNQMQETVLSLPNFAETYKGDFSKAWGGICTMNYSRCCKEQWTRQKRGSIIRICSRYMFKLHT